MALNCKQGELALVMSGPSTGQLVTCLAALPAGFQRDDLPRGTDQQICETAGPLWRIDRPLEWGDLIYLYLAPDRALMPIRPLGDGQEMDPIAEVAETDGR
jgi:hypothetical protein